MNKAFKYWLLLSLFQINVTDLWQVTCYAGLFIGNHFMYAVIFSLMTAFNTV